jgi:hypothetical protein
MSDAVIPPTTAADATDVRFSTRSLLVAMMGVAVAAAILGPYFRGIPVEDRWRVAARWSLFAAVAGVQITRFAIKRMRLERIAGPTIVSVPWRGSATGHAGRWGTYVGGLFFIAAGLCYALFSDYNSFQQGGFHGVFSFLVYPLVAGTFIAMGIMLLWWHRAAQFRANGFLYGLRLMPWTHVTNARVALTRLVLEGVDTNHVDFSFSIRLPGGSADSTIDSVLRERLSAQGAYSRFGRPVERSQIESNSGHIPPIPIKLGRGQTFRWVISFALGYATFFLIVAFHPWGRAPNAYFVGMGTGAVAAIIRFWVRSRKIGFAGPIRARIGDRASSWGVLKWVLIGIASYYVTQRLAPPYTFPAWMFGSIGGFAFFNVLENSFRSHIDLCENGLVFARRLYWPWNEVRLVSWTPAGDRRLDLARGWQKISAEVLIDECDTVEMLIREKFGVSNWRIHADRHRSLSTDDPSSHETNPRVRAEIQE